jgi:hypothetical protein
MPCYPAFALLIGSAIAMNGRTIRYGTRFLTGFCSIATVAAIAILFAVRHVPTPRDISQALSSNPEAYTLSLGHMEDLTLTSFAYLRVPLALAAASFLIGAIGTVRTASKKVYITVAIMMVVFFHAARLAMISFDPYLSSRPLVEKLQKSPPGNLIVDHHYYWFSSVFFYTDRTAWLLNGRFNNLVYGSYAPNAPNVFIDDSQFRELWQSPERYYLFAKDTAVGQFESLVGKDQLNTLSESGGKVLLTNHPVPSSVPPNAP